MNSPSFLSTFFLNILRKLLFIWVRTDIKGVKQEELNLDPDKPVCYVLQYSSLSSRLVLENACKRSDLPSSQQSVQVGNSALKRSFFFLNERHGRLFKTRQTPAVSEQLKQIIKETEVNNEQDVQIVPVSLFWGRSPEKQDSWFKLLWSDDWSVAGPIRKFFIILFHGRQTLVQFSPPISLQQTYESTDRDANRTERKLLRVLRVHFRRVRQTVLGPSLSHRQNLVHEIVNSSAIRTAIAEEAKSEDGDLQSSKQKALEYADEIAANLHISNIHFLQILLRKLWMKIYNGVNMSRLDVVKDVTRDHAVIYVPCHRSHIDYLLLSWVLFTEGIMVPHIAAGINLNFPVIGPLLRGSGAFFMRRSFKGNKLYSAVFAEYIHTMFKHGYSIEYFVEGGRSRTGRMLSPRPGMVSMTVSSYLRDSDKPIAFVPVYIGYEKVLEGSTYQGELRGKKKKNESIFGLVKSLKNLRKSFGKVNVNFGNPIYLEKYLDEAQPTWKNDAKTADTKPEWFNGVVTGLSQEIVTRINAAAAINPVNLLSLVLLSTQRHSMDAKVLVNQMDLFASLLKQRQYSDFMTFPEGSGSDWLDYCEKMGFVSRQKHELGDIVTLDERTAISLTYNRNNILHFFAIPSLIACLLQNNASMEKQRLHGFFRAIYPYIRSEYFLQWDSENIDEIFESWLTVLTDTGLLEQKDELLIRPEPGSSQFVQLSVLARFIMQTLERYYIAIAVLTQAGSNCLDADELEKQSTQMAERMSILFGLNAPEFFDKALFRNFIAKLKSKQVISENEDGQLCYSDQIEYIVEDARLILNAELRQAITQVTNLN